jgi:L-seryl-tRNA(Ser) seleniumtransferase
MEKILSHPDAAALVSRFGRECVKIAARAVLRKSPAGDPSVVLSRCADELEKTFSPEAPRVVNATGVLIHTNLGRAPLSDAVRRAIGAASEGYHAVELDLESGKRGARGARTAALVARLVGAEDALVVNNNAAAVLLALAATASGRDVLVSRGELVAIGGSFKIPEILETSGARLREVGTTNRTKIEDFARAVTPSVGAILTVHPSNYEVRGYTRRASFAEIAALCLRRRIPWIHDQGSGAIADLAVFGIAGEERAVDALRAGAALAAFSGDKLFAGPQAGILAGDRKRIEACRRHPLARALRADKLTLAGVFACAAQWLALGPEAFPIYTLAGAPVPSLRARAERAAAAARAPVRAEVVDTEAVFGGGTTPERSIPSAAVSLSDPGRSADRLSALLRHGIPPVVGRVQDRRLILDFRTVFPDEDEAVLLAVRAL